ncbi:MAG: folylpolyglutamate synthase/dihydrofolate synthase family protein [Marinoscillum sp.]|uniref:bifunctional folylpolyglutamate synthase/dihydrofolate synthase n=1 Tax=Marinoscillum sp. TaxID=2024838 RepID=UPI003300C1F1
MDYQQALTYLYERLPMFQRVGAVAFKKDLGNTVRLLEALGNPQNNFKSVHVAGTNGKGSSAHALASILQSAGYKTGLYTSPHLKEFTERIRLNGGEVSQDFVGQFVSQHQGLIEDINPSFFEVTVAMAFKYFASEEVDIAIIETGLGGRLDSTNVIDPLVSLITMIGYDHADLLGNTLPAIAAEKAGIIKPGRPVVIGANQPDLLSVFKAKAREVGAPLKTMDKMRVVTGDQGVFHQNFEVSEPGEPAMEYRTDITANYFLKNIPGVLGVVHELRGLGFTIEKGAIKQGFAQIKSQTGLKGRWQMIGQSPMVVADVSHNEPGVAQLLEQVSLVPRRRLHLIIGMVRDKDISGVLKLLPKEATYYFTQSSVPRSLPAVDLRLQAEVLGLLGDRFINVNQALKEAEKNAHSDDFILICGSTFVVAEIEHL